MGYFEEIVFKTVETLKWPALCLIAIILFRSTVEKLLARAKSAAFGDKSFEFAEPSAISVEQKKQTEPAVTEQAPSGELPPPPPSDAIAPIELDIRHTLETSVASEQIKMAWLIRGLANARIQRLHEMNYRLILGSQLALLLRLNTGAPVRNVEAREIYEQAKKNYPAIYETFAYADWVKWPKNVGLLTQADETNTGLLAITPAARDFLHYLVDNGLTGDKIG